MTAKQINSREAAKIKHAPGSIHSFITKVSFRSIHSKANASSHSQHSQPPHKSFLRPSCFRLPRVPPPESPPVPEPRTRCRPRARSGRRSRSRRRRTESSPGPTPPLRTRWWLRRRLHRRRKAQFTGGCGGFRRRAGGQACDAFRENEPERNDSNQPECTSAMFCCAHESVATSEDTLKSTAKKNR